MDGTAQLALMVVMVLAAVGALAARRTMLAKMALRNINRKRTYSVIIVAGLMVATAMIAAGLVVGDTLDYVIKQEVIEDSWAADIIVTVQDDAGSYTYFNESVGSDLAAVARAGQVAHVDGAQPSIEERVTLLNQRTGLPFAGATLVGYDFGNAINPLYDENGDDVTAEDLSAGHIVLNEFLADDINAEVGDTLTLVTEDGNISQVVVAHIALDKGMASWRSSPVALVSLGDAQTLLGKPAMIDIILVSCTGGKDEGYLFADQAIPAIESALPAGYDFTLEETKADGIKVAEESADQVTQIFVVMSSFAIIAGVALIINIFVMLAEERKPEMGISRAVGMQRGDLTQAFMFEGAVYALLASGVGALVGLVVAAFMIGAFSAIFGGQGFEITLHFEWSSIAVAAFAGFLITMLTVVLASWRVSKLNIVRAIRDIPEPSISRSSRKNLFAGVLALALGVLFTLSGASTKQAAELTIGPSLIALGAATVSMNFVKPRIPFTLAGAFLIYWMLDPTDVMTVLFGELEGNIEMFIISGMVLVTGGVIIAMFNSDLLMAALIRTFGRGKSLLPVFKTAISYPMNKKFRTALTLFIFSLIMFTVIVISMIASFQRESVDVTAERFAGGFELIGFSMREIPAANLTQGLANLNATFEEGVIDRVESATQTAVSIRPGGGADTYRYAIVGFDESMLMSNEFALQSRADEYATDHEAWAALAMDPNVAIMDGTVVQQLYGANMNTFFVDVGDTVTVIAPEGREFNVTIIGLMSQILVNGVFVSHDKVLEYAPSSSANIFYFSTPSDVEHAEDEVAKALEKEFFQYGLRTFSVRDTVKMFLAMSSSVMQLFEIFLGIGLVVGITGLGIITIRNVAERRQEIGVMRAIGYQRGMVLNSFLLETSFVSLLGITIGVLLGVALSWRMHDWGGFSETSRFVVPWGEVLLVTFVAFGITLLSTLPPSRRAAMLAPAEALRKVD